MNPTENEFIARAKSAALEVLLHNAHGPFAGLPRTAGWGYSEPYTRDLMISSLGILASGNPELLRVLKKVLTTAARNQSPLGHIPSLVHDPEDRGASDTTPLFLMAVAPFRRVTDDGKFLQAAVSKALLWMDYQSPSNRAMVAQLPTSDWRDEQWVLGYGLYVNTVVYIYLRLLNRRARARQLRQSMEHFAITGGVMHRHVHEGLLLRHKPYYALWSYKVDQNERFDLLGNSLAILSGIASATRARALLSWIEKESAALREKGDLAIDLTPCLLPYMTPDSPDWRPRYAHYNQPGTYHNGGIWPFICGFHVAALVAAGRYRLAEKKLVALTDEVKKSRNRNLEFGFNEWLRAQDGTPQGEDWQTWSAAMYLYAAECVENRSTLFFDGKAGIARRKLNAA
jgi:hypothetical protein